MSKWRHFYLNKYIVSPFIGKRYYLSYCYTYKALWFRTYKVASRTIDKHFRENSQKQSYIYSSKTGYLPFMFRNYFKFAFVRNPIDRFLSAWKQKVLMSNSFNFSDEIYKEMHSLENFINWAETLDIDNCDEHLQSQNSMIDLNNIDFIGRFENFELDFKYVAEKINLPMLQVYHENRSNSSELEIDSNLMERIKLIYKKDINFFYGK